MSKPWFKPKPLGAMVMGRSRSGRLAFGLMPISWQGWGVVALFSIVFSFATVLAIDSRDLGGAGLALGIAVADIAALFLLARGHIDFED